LPRLTLYCSVALKTLVFHDVAVLLKKEEEEEEEDTYFIPLKIHNIKNLETQEASN